MFARRLLWFYFKGHPDGKYWVGGGTAQNIFQRGFYRDFKWLRSDVNVPSTAEYWRSRYLSKDQDVEGFDYLHSGMNSKLFDGYEHTLKGFVCEWSMKHVFVFMTTLTKTNAKTSIFRQDITMYISAYVLMHTVP